MVQCGECGKPLGGKSGTGRIEKHFYYGHPQIKNPLAQELKPKCQVKNVRAPRLEEIILSSLKQLLQEPGLIEKWVSIYKEKSASDLPEVQSRQKLMDTEIQTTGRRITNLVQRVADLPVEVPVDQFYEQIKQLNLKLNDLKLAKEKLKTQSVELLSQQIDEEGLKERIKSTISTLTNTAAEKQRPIFANLIKFIEIHPTKIKIGMYAPAKSAEMPSDDESSSSKATGTDGISINLKKEGTVLPFDRTRVGSSTEGIGARRGT